MNSTVASDRQRSQATCNAHTDLPHAQHHSESPQMCAPRHPIAPVAPPARYPHTKHRRGSSHTFKSHASAERLTRAAPVAIQAPLLAASTPSVRSRARPPAPVPRACAGSSPLQHLGSPQSRRATAAAHKGVSMQGAQPPGVPCTPIARAHRQRVEPGSEMAADEIRELGLVGRRSSASSCTRLRGSDTRRSKWAVYARRRVFTRSRQRATIEARSRIELTWVRDGRSITWDHPPASASREHLFVAASAAQFGHISRPTIAGSAGRGRRAGSRSNGGRRLRGSP